MFCKISVNISTLIAKILSGCLKVFTNWPNTSSKITHCLAIEYTEIYSIIFYFLTRTHWMNIAADYRSSLLKDYALLH